MPVIRNATVALHRGHAPSKQTGQVGSINGIGQWPGVAHDGQCHLALPQQLQTLAVIAWSMWSFMASGAVAGVTALSMGDGQLFTGQAPVQLLQQRLPAVAFVGGPFDQVAQCQLSQAGSTA
jgi:hypothetical protein